MPKYIFYTLILLITAIFLSCTKKVEEYSSSKLQDDVIYQYSTRDILVDRNYEGSLSFSQLRKRGNFGLGTFNALDGEMICIDGDFLKIDGSSRIIEVDDDELTPFVTLKFFQIDTTIALGNQLSMDQTYLQIAELINDELFAAIRIKGKFKYLKARSIDKQPLPYPVITEVVDNQHIFEFSNVEGTLIGFKFPDFLSNVNFTGFHFHFVTNDRNGGGHVLDFQSENITVDVDHCSELNIELIEE